MITQNLGVIIGIVITAAAFYYLGLRSKIEFYITRLEGKEELIKELQQEVRKLREHAKGLEAVVEDYHQRFVEDSKGRRVI